MTSLHFRNNRSGFSLIEVVLALGVFFISILALIGLLSPMLRSVDEIEKIDEISSVVNTVNAFLQSSPEIATRGPDPNDNTKTIVTKTKFNAIYEAVSSAGDEATIFVYRYYDDNDMIRLEVGFSESERGIVGDNSLVNEPGSNPANFNDAAGPIYRVVLTASSVTPLTPVALRSADRTDGIYTLTQTNIINYTEGYLALEARIFAEDPPGPDGTFITTTNLTELNNREPDFTFNTAIVR
jgi:type II secretory pathway pseudopilin PulG